MLWASPVFIISLITPHEFQELALEGCTFHTMATPSMQSTMPLISWMLNILNVGKLFREGLQATAPGSILVPHRTKYKDQAINNTVEHQAVHPRHLVGRTTVGRKISH